VNALLVVTGLFVYGIVGAPQKLPQFSQEVATTRLGEGLYLLDGAGGNVIAYVWSDGVLLVDDKITPVAPKLKAAVATITDKPIRFVLNTHWHPDHSGGNEALAGDGAVAVAHENVRRRMSVGNFIELFDRKLPAAPAGALPIVTFTRDVKFHLDGEEISVVHVEAAHTDGDSFIRFGRANIVHMGDCFLNGSFPVIDYSSGGTYPGTISAADAALGMADPATRIVPGHGPVASPPELREWRDMLATILERVRKAVSEGKTLEQVKAERPAREWEDRFPNSFVTSDHVVEEAWRSATGSGN
jgi:cyclase